MFQIVCYAALNEVNTNLVTILHDVLDKIIEPFENNDVEPEHHIILQTLFQSLELLYNNMTLTESDALLIHNWLHHFCKSHNVEGAEHAIVYKLLFTQMIRTKKGDIFEGIAKQIELKLGQIKEVRS